MGCEFNRMYSLGQEREHDCIQYSSNESHVMILFIKGSYHALQCRLSMTFQGDYRANGNRTNTTDVTKKVYTEVVQSFCPQLAENARGSDSRLSYRFVPTSDN